MNILSLTKTTLVCGLMAFVFYSFPIFSQVITITFLGFLWMASAHQTLTALRR